MGEECRGAVGRTCCAWWRPVAASPRGWAAPPRRRVIPNKHSNRDQSMTYLPGECAYRRADEEEDIQRLNGEYSYRRTEGLTDARTHVGGGGEITSVECLFSTTPLP